MAIKYPVPKFFLEPGKTYTFKFIPDEGYIETSPAKSPVQESVEGGKPMGMKFALTSREDLATGPLGDASPYHLSCGLKLLALAGTRYYCPGCAKTGMLLINPTDNAKMGFPTAKKSPQAAKQQADSEALPPMTPLEKAKLKEAKSCPCASCEEQANSIISGLKKKHQESKEEYLMPDAPFLEELKKPAKYAKSKGDSKKDASISDAEAFAKLLSVVDEAKSEAAKYISKPKSDISWKDVMDVKIPSSAAVLPNTKPSIWPWEILPTPAEIKKVISQEDVIHVGSQEWIKTDLMKLSLAWYTGVLTGQQKADLSASGFIPYSISPASTKLAGLHSALAAFLPTADLDGAKHRDQVRKAYGSWLAKITGPDIEAWASKKDNLFQVYNNAYSFLAAGSLTAALTKVEKNIIDILVSNHPELLNVTAMYKYGFKI